MMNGADESIVADGAHGGDGGHNKDTGTYCVFHIIAQQDCEKQQHHHAAAYAAKAADRADDHTCQQVTDHFSAAGIDETQRCVFLPDRLCQKFNAH